MKQFFLACAIAFIGALLVVQDADARRLGGGKSFGRSSPSALQQRQQAAPSRQSPARPGAYSGARRWLGPLAGLAAGGLLAALLFGDAFDGLQLFDILIIAGLIFGAIWLFRNLRRQNAPAMQRQAVAAGPGSYSPPSEPRFGGSSEAQSSSRLLEDRERPAWFDENAFLQAAKTHFIRLQAAWDKGDMKDIREYTTPELFAQLSLDRQNDGGAEQFTEVVTLNAELLGLVQEGDQIIASVRYSGLIREERNAEAKPFSEIWHVQRSMNQSDADWYVAGIEQENYS